ncbi:MAG: flagellar basal body-associated FliL family protein [Bdellovibrio sp.]|nr:flagellar basal body-associated FliL family protein [Bdellovibrio sp.]
MAENENPTKVEEIAATDVPGEEQEELLSLESLDSAIAEADPEFSKALDEIQPDDLAPIEIYNEGLETEYTLAEEVKLWQSSPGKRAKFAKFFPFLPKISYFLKIKRAQFRLNVRKWKEQSIHNLKNAGPLTLAWGKAKAASLRSGVGEVLGTFKSFSGKKKAAFAGLVVVTIGAGFILFKLVTNGILPHKEDLFIASLADWSQQKIQYDPVTERESFYDSTRLSQNILVMKKMVVNLKPSEGSGPTPMGAFEFYVEGTVSEVVVEIKDRESEMEDLFMRTIEDMTYDQISSAEGKQQLSARLRQAVNKSLTKGHVRRVFLKTAIVKP